MLYVGNPDNSERNPKREFLAVLVTVIVLGGITWGINYYNSTLLESYDEVRAKVIEKNSVLYGPNTIVVEFKNKGTIVKSDPFVQEECFYKLKEGDSILVKFSEQNPNIVQIINCRPIYRKID